jgi:translation initiation factor IF-2
VLATLLVQKGTLRVGDLLVAGATYGKVRLMHNDKGKKVDEATISMPVEILGLNDAPVAGDEFAVVKTDKQARDISAYRERKLREKKNLSLNKATSIEQLFIQAGQNIKELALVIKTDVHGSAEAISASLQKIEHPEVKIKILHCAVGAITDSDITLAQASNAFIMGFNVRANSSARSMIEQNNIEIRYYSIIYNLIDDVRAMLSGLLSPEISEKFIGNAEIREVFNITKMGKIAGCYVTNGVIKRGAGVRLLRDNVVIHEGKLKTLRRFKENVKEVRDNFECGVAFENYDDIKVGDVVEAFEIVETKKEL